MKTAIVNILIFTVTFCVSCGSGTRSADADVDAVGTLAAVDGNGLVTIDVSADYPKEEIVLQDIADVEYVPLAISKEVLLKNSDDIFYISDRYIMVYGRGNIFVFNRDGSIRSHFNREGRGPGEFLMFRDVVFDETAEEFFVKDGIPPNHRVLVYSIDGTYKRTLPMPEKWSIRTMWNFDVETLLVFEENGLHDGNFSKTPYYLISKTDGSIVDTIAIEMPLRYSNTSFMELTDSSGKTSREPVQLHTGANKRFGGRDFTIADISSDTLYHLSRQRVPTPVLVRTPSVHLSKPRIVWSANLITENFIVFTITTLDFEGAMKNGTYPIRELMYNFKTKRISNPDFINDDTSKRWSAGIFETQAPTNLAVDMLDPLRLKESHEKGELSGPLAEIAATIKEDDNPVVMIVTFK